MGCSGMSRDEPAEEVLRFITDQIDTVPHLEALLLLWEGRGRLLSTEQVAAKIYVPIEQAGRILEDLLRRRLVKMGPSATEYEFDARWDATGEFMPRLATTYRRHLIRIATTIHAKASPAVREFARAFEPKKDK
jgi:hypothetical protein